jgi:integrase
MSNQTSDSSAPIIETFTVKRRYLTEREVERLMDTARKIGRHGHRDATMILVAYRHGLRASEVCSLEWHHRTRPRQAACPQNQAWNAERPSHPW